MTAPTLRAALEALRRDGEAPAHPLSADAEREIRRRVGTRTGLRGGALLAVAGLAVATASASWGSRAEDPAPSPTPTATFEPSVASATFPLEGGPEFEPLYRSIGCGDPAPAPHPVDHEIGLSARIVAQGMSGTVRTVSPDGVTTRFTYGGAQFSTELSYEGAGGGGVVAHSGVMLVAVRDGVVVGLQRNDPELGWRLDAGTSSAGFHTLSTDLFQCPSAPAWEARNPAALEPGTYDIIAVARVFSTPESVALSRVMINQDVSGLEGSFLETHPEGIYLPGSYDCSLHTADGIESPPRGCLPDVTDRASVDAEAGTITVLYDPRDLVEEFSVVLVSEPVAVELESFDVGELPWQDDMPRAKALDSLDAIVCGAQGSGVWIPNTKDVSVAMFTDVRERLVPDVGAQLPSSVLVSGVPDGSRATLLPGARLIYLRWDIVEFTTDGHTYFDSVQAIGGIAAVTASGSVTTDGYAGPQPLGLAVKPADPCEGSGAFESDDYTHAVIAGTWRVETPQGRDFTIDAASEIGQTMDFG